MKSKNVSRYIRAVFDLDCTWQGLPPSYQIYVENELFAERTWCWTDHYTEEILQIESTPGIVVVTLRLLPPAIAEFRLSNHRIEYGNAFWVDQSRIKIPV